MLQYSLEHNKLVVFIQVINAQRPYMISVI